MPVEIPTVPEDISGHPRRMPVGNVTWRTTFRALRHRNYRLFFWGQLVSLIGTWLEQTAISWYVYQLTGSKLLLGVVSAVGSAPMMLFSIWGGSLADRFPKRTILVITQIAQMLFAFVLAAGAWAGFASPSFIILIAGLNGLALAFDMPARQAFTVEMTSREDLLNAISLNSSIFNCARVVGPAIAGVMVDIVGVPMCFFLNGLSFLSAIAGLMKMHIKPMSNDTQKIHGDHALSGIVYCIRHQRVRTILLLFFVVGVFGWSFSVLMPAFATDVLKLGANGYGILMAASGTGALAGGLTIATYGHLVQPRKLALGGVYVFSIALLAFAATRNFYFALLPLFVAGFGMLMFFSTSNTVVQTIVPDEMRGRVMGVWSVVFGAMIPIGSLQVGAMAHWFGAPAAVAIGAAMCIIAAVVARVLIALRETKID